MILRCYYVERASHVHCRIFAGQNEGAPLGYCGPLVFREAEFQWFVAHSPAIDFQEDKSEVHGH